MSDKKEETKSDSAEAVSDKEESKQEPKEQKISSVKLASKLEKIAKEIEGLTALELSELSSYLEDKFGVSAMPMPASNAAGAVAGAAGDVSAVDEKTSYSVVLSDVGANKLAVIKAVREIKPDLGLMDAKKLVESAPKEVVAGVKKADAEAAKKKIEDAGGKVELK